MFKTIKTKILGAAALVLAAIGFAPDAKAYEQDYCREYTRTVYIGGRTQDAFGTACLQPDGDWVIVGEGLGNDIPAYADNVSYVIRDNRRMVTPKRVVYYDRYYRTRNAGPTFIWYQNGYYKNGRNYKFRNWDRHDRWDRHGRDDHRGRGRGHDRH